MRAFLIYLIFIPSFLQAAKTDSLPSARKTVSLKLYYAPQLSYRVKISERTEFNEGQADFGYRTLSYDSDDEIPRKAVDCGFLLEFRLTEKLNLNTGITFDRQGFSTRPTEVKHASPSYSNPGTYCSNIESQVVNYSIYFISHPVIINYEFAKKDTRYCYAGGGLDSKFRCNYSINGGAIGSDIHRYSLMGNYFAIINIGMNVSLKNKFCLFLEPFYKTQIGRTYFEDGNLELRLWSAGCRLGLKF